MRPLNHDWIAARIPHQGAMCLLDAVLDWNDLVIECRAFSHRRAKHPLRAAGRLGIACGIEYAAQAMAVHGALRAGAETAPAAGFLTGVREVVWQGPYLDEIATELTVRAECIARNDQHVLYQFRLAAAGAQILSGRASVLLTAP